MPLGADEIYMALSDAGYFYRHWQYPVMFVRLRVLCMKQTARRNTVELNLEPVKSRQRV